MRNLTLLFGLSGVVMFSAWACSDEVTETPTTASTTSSASGGGGSGASSSVSSTAMSSSTGMMMNCDNSPDTCVEACCHIEVECALPVTCAQAGQLLGIDLSDCTNPTSECISNCIINADCADLVAAAQMMGPVYDCAVGCAANACLQCALANCGTEANACQNAPACAPFITCAAMCADGDAACLQTCAAMNDSPETQALVACASTNCGGPCLGQGGAGGGTGGAGGN
jgi:hypothetical protein